MKLTYHPLEPKRWRDFETLFGERGACGGCWCMSWRISRKEFEAQKGSGNKRAMHRLVKNREQTGILVYADGRPMGWCAVAPRESFTRLEHSRVLKPIDNKQVWSIVCFFLAREYRRKGYSSDILKGVAAHCKKYGAKILEAYPVIPYSTNMPAAFAWTGFLSAFLRAGFVRE
ncbi:MAG TPA: GNAT family N-acetyltransferase, partial [Bacteroidota bacterium]|nr:GNAT family N-acetyltransferase [Bacteroidota bacterium]